MNNVFQCFLILALSKSMIWINENVLGAHRNILAQHYFHLKETQEEERLVVMEDFPKGLFATLEKRAIITSLQRFPSRLICIINTKISLHCALTIRTACKGSLVRAELRPRQTGSLWGCPQVPDTEPWVPGRARTDFMPCDHLPRAQPTPGMPRHSCGAESKDNSS